jgi:hypothetical protein
LVGNPEGKKPLGRPRRRWDDNIKLDLKNRMGRCGMDSFASGYEEVVGSCEHGDERPGSVKLGKILD